MRVRAGVRVEGRLAGWVAPLLARRGVRVRVRVRGTDRARV